MSAEDRTASRGPPPAEGPQPELLPLGERVRIWLMEDAPAWLISMMLHAVLLLAVGLFMGREVVRQIGGDAPVLETSTTEAEAGEQPVIERFEIGQAPLEPTELGPHTLDLNEPGRDVFRLAQEAKHYDDNPLFKEEGGGILTGSQTGSGGLGLDLRLSGLGPVLRGSGGADPGQGLGTGWGKGGAGTGFGSRGQGHREALLGRYGGTRQTERAVAGALNWLARHQNPDGSWSIRQRVSRKCTCTGYGAVESLAAATALGLLPFLGSGVTHKTKTVSEDSTTAKYRQVVAKGLKWLTSHQRPNGDLSAGSYQMYAHGLAAITLCEAYGMTQDAELRRCAEAAIKFIETGQNVQGGWRYNHGQPDSDTSVFGWQMMALKSGQIAGLAVNPAQLEAGRKWLERASAASRASQRFGRFAYQEQEPPTPCMSSVGLLITQYLGASRDDPVVVEGAAYLLANLPSVKERNTYYWYYATQVLHHLADARWDTWNREMRRILVETQCQGGCAEGSWDPMRPTQDPWGLAGGRLMMTSLSALTLEVYYRHLPLYQLDQPERADIPPAAKEAADAAR
mgnify:CR=1 FL=1